MDYGEMDTVKAEKMIAMKKFKRNRKAKKYLRYAFVALTAVLLSWSSVWIPIVVQTTALYIRWACTMVTNPRFVFIMCNLIILTLVAKSGQLSSSSGGSNLGSPDVYEEFVRTSENRQRYVVNLSEQGEEEEEVVKQCISEEAPTTDQPEEVKSTVPDEELVQNKEIVEVEVPCSSHKKFARSQSAKLVKKPVAQKLRRSETSIENHCLLPENSNSCDSEAVEEGMEILPLDLNEGNDDLKKRFDDFIAKQQNFRRQEFRQEMVNV